MRYSTIVHDEIKRSSVSKCNTQLSVLLFGLLVFFILPFYLHSFVENVNTLLIALLLDLAFILQHRAPSILSVHTFYTIVKETLSYGQ